MCKQLCVILRHGSLSFLPLMCISDLCLDGAGLVTISTVLLQGNMGTKGVDVSPHPRGLYSTPGFSQVDIGERCIFCLCHNPKERDICVAWREGSGEGVGIQGLFIWKCMEVGMGLKKKDIYLLKFDTWGLRSACCPCNPWTLFAMLHGGLAPRVGGVPSRSLCGAFGETFPSVPKIRKLLETHKGCVLLLCRTLQWNLKLGALTHRPRLSQFQFKKTKF